MSKNTSVKNVLVMRFRNERESVECQGNIDTKAPEVTEISWFLTDCVLEVFQMEFEWTRRTNPVLAVTVTRSKIRNCLYSIKDCWNSPSWAGRTWDHCIRLRISRILIPSFHVGTSVTKCNARTFSESSLKWRTFGALDHVGPSVRCRQVCGAILTTSLV